MQIKHVKINGFGVLKDKFIDFKPQINLIIGNNESGKSTFLDCLHAMFYGVSKNKNNKEISSYEKYMPWSGDEFSTEASYKMDNGKTFRVFRDFKKNKCNIYNENNEDISSSFSIDKAKKNQFFCDITGLDEDLIFKTAIVSQKEVGIEKNEQKVLANKIINLLQTGDDNISYKKSVDALNKKLLEECGTSRSVNKPINIIEKEIEKYTNKKQELSMAKDKYESLLNDKILKEKNLENQEEIVNKLKQNKTNKEKEYIEQEIKKRENKSSNVYIRICIIFILLATIWLIPIINNIIKYVFTAGGLISTIVLVLFQRKIKPKNDENADNGSLEIFLSTIEDEENELNEIKLKIHKLEISIKQNEEALEDLMEVDEKLEVLQQKKEEIIHHAEAIELAIKGLEETYAEIKQNIIPHITKEISSAISNLTNGKYKEVKFNDEQGMLVTLSSGEVVNLSRLSIGTMDQMYLMLRLTFLKEITKNEKVPIIMDEAFAYYDDIRLKNCLMILEKIAEGSQIVILSSNNNEKNILDKMNIDYNLIRL